MSGAQTEEAPNVSGVRQVRTFSTGRVRIHPEHVHGSRLPSLAWILLSSKWEPWRPIYVYVIEHAEGLVLFDTGQDRASITEPDYYPPGVMRLVYRRLAEFEMAPNETVSSQIGQLGYSIGDVRWVVLSHLHQDHIGGLRELINARFVASAVELTSMRASNAEMAGLLPLHTDLPGARWEPITFTSSTDLSIAPFTQAHDLLGDGSLTLLPTPGHTSGSISMLVRHSGTPLLLAGDLTYDLEVMRQGAIPGVGDRRLLQETSHRVLELERRLGAVAILPAHDPASAVRLAEASTAALR